MSVYYRYKFKKEQYDKTLVLLETTTKTLTKIGHEVGLDHGKINYIQNREISEGRLDPKHRRLQGCVQWQYDRIVDLSRTTRLNAQEIGEKVGLTSARYIQRRAIATGDLDARYKRLPGGSSQNIYDETLELLEKTDLTYVDIGKKVGITHFKVKNVQDRAIAEGKLDKKYRRLSRGIIQWRYDKALELLQTTDCSLEQIAKESGIGTSREPAYNMQNKAIAEGRLDPKYRRLHGLVQWQYDRALELLQTTDWTLSQIKKDMGVSITALSHLQNKAIAEGKLDRGKKRLNTGVLEEQHLRRITAKSNVTHWDNGRVDQVFDETSAKLGRVPTIEEFTQVYSGAADHIRSGRYDPKIRTWNQYLEYRNLEPNITFWDRNKFDEAFDKIMDKLGRIPTANEFTKKYGGPLGYIYDGKYDPEITTWTQYLEHRGLEPNNISWDNKKFDQAFDNMTNELGRIPTNKEFHKKHGGALRRIYDGKYDPSITTWNQYLEHRGVRCAPIKTTDQFQMFFEHEETARFVAEHFGGRTEDVADILAVIYNNRITREDAFDLLEQPSLRAYIGKIRKPDTGIAELAEEGTHILSLDKGGVIYDIILRRMQELRREKLGSNPTPETRNDFVSGLENELHELEAGAVV